MLSSPRCSQYFLLSLLEMVLPSDEDNRSIIPHPPPFGRSELSKLVPCRFAPCLPPISRQSASSRVIPSASLPTHPTSVYRVQRTSSALPSFSLYVLLHSLGSLFLVTEGIAQQPTVSPSSIPPTELLVLPYFSSRTV